ncbi:MAG: sterol desaturase family protein [Flavobacteriales bacterium]|nr:sterol desaturase family protein [Flavobacteriales bacterium]
MEYYIKIFTDNFIGYYYYLLNEITFQTDPWYHNYFWWLVMVSLVFWGMELVKPWREKQSAIRRDFWLDAFYMFFNFFFFSLIGYAALSNVVVDLFNSFLGLFGIHNLVALEIATWAVPLQLLTMFVLRDFVQWNVHRLLHRVPFLWEFHKLHHSVKEMGFAAHLRYHWMETIVYRSIEYIPLAMIGFGIDDFFIVHMVALVIGHFNHANIHIPLGPLKYLFNNPQMHIWHHAKKLPNAYGVNFGLSLSVWDYLFGTAYIPESGRDVELGFDGDEEYPQDFIHQEISGFKKAE